jgi:hypothetical protein
LNGLVIVVQVSGLRSQERQNLLRVDVKSTLSTLRNGFS